MKLIVSLLGISVLCVQVLADELDLSLNANALRVQYAHDFESNQLSLDGGWLYHEDNGSAVHVGLHLIDLAASGRDKVEAGIGGRVVYTNGDSSRQNGFAVPLGGFVRITPRAMNRLSVSGSAYYAPSILSIGDMEKYQEFSIRVSYNVLRQADAYIGARYVRGDYDDAPDVRYDTGMHIGMTLRF